jgi:hypothetical protein
MNLRSNDIDKKSTDFINENEEFYLNGGEEHINSMEVITFIFLNNIIINSFF